MLNKKNYQNDEMIRAQAHDVEHIPLYYAEPESN